MKDGNHIHNESNPQGLHRHKKLMVFGVIAIVIAIAAYDLGQTATETANINNVFEIVVNNTNLAPSIHGVPGTGERITGVTYYTNSSPIQILVFAHATNVSQTAFVELTINGTVVLPQSGRPLGGAEQSNRSVSAIIPKYSNYSVIIENEHHYEWREYPILSGKNGTLSINQTNVINQTVSDAQLNTKVNKSGDTITGNLNITGNSTIQNSLSIGHDGVNQFAIVNLKNSSYIPSAVLSTNNQFNSTIATYGVGSAYFLGRDTINNIEFIIGTSTLGEAFAGAMTNHSFGLRTNNINRIKIFNSSGVVQISNLSKTGAQPIYADSNGNLTRGNNNSVFDGIKINSISKNDTSVNDTIILNNNYACSDRNGSSCFIYSSPKSSTYLRFDNSTSQIRMLTQGETFYPWARLSIEPTLFDFTMENNEIDNYINIADRVSLHANNKNTFGSADYILQTYNAGAGLDMERHMFFINNTDRLNINFTTTKVNNDLLVSNLSGTGNAYVCVDSTGTLYRSVTACV